MLNHNWIIAQSRRCVSRSQARPLDSQTDGVESRLERNLQPIPVEAGYRSTARTRTTTALSTVLFSILTHLSFLWGWDSSGAKDVHCPFRKQPPARNTSLIQILLDWNMLQYIPLAAGYWRQRWPQQRQCDEGRGTAWRSNSTVHG